MDHMPESSSGIGTLGESSLHAELKHHVAQPGDLLEQPVANYVVDIVRGKSLVEIQTGNFSSLKAKLDVLLPDYQVSVVYPIPREKWIVRISAEGELIRRRKSPKRGRIEHLFDELLRIPVQACHPNFSLSIMFIKVDEYWLDDGKGSWRRKRWSIADRKIFDIEEEICFSTPGSLLDLLPADLIQPFTSKDLGSVAALDQRLAGKMTYTLYKMGLLERVGKQQNAYLYASAAEC
jgi:hypothetical protein